MAKRVDQDWYLREWMQLLDKRHVDMVREMPMLPGQASKIMNGAQPYKRDLVIRIADWLGIRPFELLMPPQEALALRRIRETAALIASEMPANIEIDQLTTSPNKGALRRASK